MQVNAILNGRVLTALAILLIFLSMLLMALGFPPKARLLPLLVSVPGSLLAVVQLLSEIRTIDSDMPDRECAAAERHMFFWIAMFFAGILLFGFNLAAPVLVFAFLLLGRRESLTIASVSAVATWGVLYGFFEVGFELPLFSGLLMEWLTA